MSEKSKAETFGSLVTAVLAIATFAWGIYTYRDAENAQLAKDEADAQRTAETRRIEATRPFLEKQLDLCTRATQITAKIPARALQNEAFQEAKTAFRELYWGEMGLIERGDVERAMVRYGEALDKPGGASIQELSQLALGVAHACRKELAMSWGTDAWLPASSN